MRRLRAFEDMLVRVESAIAVALVLLMLALASYNVIYRNVLAPLQLRWAHSGPPIAPAAPPEPTAIPAAPATSDAKAPTPTTKPAGDDFGGFTNDEDEDADEDAKADDAKAPAPTPAPTKPAGDDFGGFTNDEDEDAPAPAKAASKPSKPAGDDFGGFTNDEDEADEGGAQALAAADDLGDVPAKAEEEADDLGGDDPFANLAKVDARGSKDARELPKGGPPPQGSFAAWAVAFIDDVKLEWIDVLVRQLVILVAFFGAMLATTRRSHINVDAFSRLLGPVARRWLAVVTNGLATFVCAMLAKTGSQLVAIGREYPSQIVPWAEEWQFQLMYPLGFGLLAFHFAIRALEHATNTAPAEAAAARTNQEAA
jgi:TRAP-type C4-dicarboxylate transport system permease small subunit